MASDLVRNLRARLSFIEAQELAGADRGPLQAAAANALEMMFRQRRNADLDELTDVTREVNQRPWTADERRRLATALSDAVAFDTAGASQRGGNALTQTLHSPELFLTRSEWESIQSTRLSEAAKINVLARSWAKLGIDSPSETMLKRGASIVQWAQYDEAPSVETRRSICRSLQMEVKSIALEAGRRHDKITVYPSTPEGLPQTLWASAYPTEPPVAPPLAFVHRKAALVKQMRVRKNAKQPGQASTGDHAS